MNTCFHTKMLTLKNYNKQSVWRARIINERKETIMKGIKVILITGLFSMLIACAEPEAKYPVVIENIDGVKIVTNPDYPKDGVIEYTLVEDLSIGGNVDEENYVFHRPQDVKVDADGTIYVVDFGDSTVKLYDQEGKYISTIGGQGQGPNEFGRALQISLGSGDNIFVLDPLSYRVAILNKVGEYLGGFRIEGGSLSGFDTDSKNSIYVGINIQEEDLRWLNIRCFNRDGEESVNYGNFKLVQSIAKKVKTKGGGVIVTSSLSRLAPTTIWKVNPDGKLYVAFGDTYQVSVYNTDGSLDFKFGRLYTPVPYKPGRKPGQSTEVGIFNILTRRWLFDGEGNIWIEFFMGTEPDNFVYDGFSPDGIYLKQVIVKHRIYQLFEGKAYNLVRDEDDFIAVKSFLLVR